MNLHQLLAIKRPLIMLDTETTGLDPKDARIIEIGFQVWTADGLQKEWRSLVNPGVSIPPETTKVHGITDAVVQGCRFTDADDPSPCGEPQECHWFPSMEYGTTEADRPTDAHPFRPWPTFAQLAPNLAKGLTDVDFAGKNVRYDLRVLAAEMERAHTAWSYLDARIVDADRLEKLGEPRSLSHLYKKHVGRDPEDAHQALADVRMTTEVIEAQLRKYDALPRDLDLLHAAQWPGWIDPEGKFKFVDGVACIGQWGKWAGKPMRSVERSYWQFIIDKDFSADVKKLAMDALMGVFPEVK